MRWIRKIIEGVGGVFGWLCTTEKKTFSFTYTRDGKNFDGLLLPEDVEKIHADMDRVFEDIDAAIKRAEKGTQ